MPKRGAARPSRTCRSGVPQGQEPRRAGSAARGGCRVRLPSEAARAASASPLGTSGPIRRAPLLTGRCLSRAPNRARRRRGGALPFRPSAAKTHLQRGSAPRACRQHHQQGGQSQQRPPHGARGDQNSLRYRDLARSTAPSDAYTPSIRHKNRLLGHSASGGWARMPRTRHTRQLPFVLLSWHFPFQSTGRGPHPLSGHRKHLRSFRSLQLLAHCSTAGQRCPSRQPGCPAGPCIVQGTRNSPTSEFTRGIRGGRPSDAGWRQSH